MQPYRYKIIIFMFKEVIRKLYVAVEGHSSIYIYSLYGQLDLLAIVCIVFTKHLLDMNFLPEMSGRGAYIIIQQI